MKRKLQEEIGQKIPDTETESEQKREKKSADILGDPKGSDPLCLPDVVVGNILEHLENRSLLTGRLVCRSWNAEITSRNDLWKQRCERKQHIFRFNLSTTPLDDVFHQYVRFHHVYHRTMSGDAFRVKKHSKILDCFHGAREDNSLSQICGRRTFSEDWNDSFKKIIRWCLQLWDGKHTVLVLTEDSELVMTDLKTQTVLWRQANVELFCYDHFCHHTICAVTLSGDVKLFSLEGKCDLHIHTDGQLEDASYMARHPSNDFIVVELDNSDVHLVDVGQKRVIKLHLELPEIPVDGDVGEEEDSEGEVDDHSFAIGFMQDDSLSREQLAICLCKKQSVVVAIINTDGEILHEGYRTFSLWLSLKESDLFNKQDSHIIVRNNEWIEKFAIRCKPSGIQFNLLWEQIFPDRLLARHAQTLMCGDQFILAQEGHSLLLCKLSDAQLVVSIPKFFRRRNKRTSWRLIDMSGESPEHIVHKIQLNKDYDQWMHKDRLHHVNIFVNNTGWLNGLSPATTKPDVPILLYVSGADTDIDCLHWSADLWTGNDLQIQQLEQGKPKTGLGLHAETEHWKRTQ